MSIKTIEVLLASGRWMEADLATADYLFSLMGQRSNEWLTVDDIDRISCDRLAKLDQVWLKYNSGHFGFSIQKSIYSKLKDRYTSMPYRIAANPLKGFKPWISEILGGSSSKLSDFEILHVTSWLYVEIGWLTYNPENPTGYGYYLDYDQLTFNLNAPKGHLPCKALWLIQYQSKLIPIELLFKKYGVLGFIGCLARYKYEIGDRFFHRIGVCCNQIGSRSRSALEAVDLERESLLVEPDSYQSELDSPTVSDFLNVNSLEELLDNFLSPKNKAQNERLSELLDDLNYFGIDTSNALYELLEKYRQQIENEEIKEVRLAQRRLQEGILDGFDNPKRVRRGVFFTHVGLARIALRYEFGDEWKHYLCRNYNTY